MVGAQSSTRNGRTLRQHCVGLGVPQLTTDDAVPHVLDVYGYFPAADLRTHRHTTSDSSQTEGVDDDRDGSARYAAIDKPGNILLLACQRVEELVVLEDRRRRCKVRGGADEVAKPARLLDRIEPDRRGHCPVHE